MVGARQERGYRSKRSLTETPFVFRISFVLAIVQDVWLSGQRSEVRGLSTNKPDCRFR